MKQPVVDYRKFSFKKLNTPEFAHLKLLAGWLVYFLMYVVTERFIPESACHEMHCVIDDYIPFNEHFAILYILWYIYVSGWLLYYVCYDIPRFKRLQIFLILTQVIAVIWYIVYPSKQCLRPDEMTVHNFGTAVLSFLYQNDTNTGVCPSLHVGFSFAILSTTLRDMNLPKGIKLFNIGQLILISYTVCAVKQHSFVDVIAAIVMCLFIELLIKVIKLDNRIGCKGIKKEKCGG